MPQDVGALYVQLREAHTRDGWDTGGQYVADRHHVTMEERVAACERRPVHVRWMTPLCDSMLNTFSDVYGCVHCLACLFMLFFVRAEHDVPVHFHSAWPTAFFVFERVEEQATWSMRFHSRPTKQAHIDIAPVLAALWTEAC